ncbi:MAG: NADH-quinone oxidoreductase subunit L [Chloroflexi bacterium]|nr:MAG: NADH-quinone oxidoreductase subunit L [Chloroflexota bacterium]
MFDLAWLLFAFPAAGALINLLAGHLLTRRLIGWIAAGAVIASFAVSVALFFNLFALPPEERVITTHLWNWITIGEFEVAAALLIDPLSVVMALIVTGVGALIHVYSISYMEHDERYQRFFIYLNFFIFAMLILVLSDSFLGMFVGWEGVGLASFLLIGFWFDRTDEMYGSYADAGKKAFLVNRVGDFGMIVAMIALWSAVGSLTFLDVFEQVEHGALTVGLLNFICLLLLLGATGKSAQIPLYVWLPDAMAGPTPVSALIHAATMVTAGIYMIVRTEVLWHMAPLASSIAAWLGVLTALLGASIALVQTDLKKILAYSTVSQLGYMMLGVGVGAYGAAIFHLVTHAFFKALLFLAAGSVMHAMHDVLDIRRMGGLRRKMPATFMTFLIGAAALAGIPPWSGFFSKDAILAATLTSSVALFVVGLVAALLTAFYSARMVFLTFYGEPRDRELYDHAHESPPLMTTPLWVLAVLALTAGALNLPVLLTLERWLEPVIGEHTIGLTAELVAILLSILIAAFGVLLGYARYVAKEEWPARVIAPFQGLQRPLENKWYVDEFYMATVVNPLRAISGWFATVVDQAAIDGLVNGVAGVHMRVGEQVRRLQNGAVPTYALSILIGVVLVTIYFVFA